jgi:hypothetical protein
MRSVTEVATIRLLSIPLCIALASSLFSLSAFGEQPPSGGGQIKIEITSPGTIHGIAGQIITARATITNLGSSTIGGIAYISIVDLTKKIPIDLEDWSAEKGIDIPSLAPGQSLPTEWKVRLVKDGSYTISILFSASNDSLPPTASGKIFLNVDPKHNLNPGNILPVAFGVPSLLMIILGAINYSRGRKMGVYK